MEMERIFLREQPETAAEKPLPRETARIGVVGMASGVGTTFIAVCLAAALADGKATETVGFLELSPAWEGASLLYDSLGMDKRFAGREFVDFYETVRKKQRFRGIANMDERISWALRTPDTFRGEAKKELTAAEKFRLIGGLSVGSLICDLGCDPQTGNEELDEMESLLAEMDTIVFVIDPMPARLLCGQRRISLIKKLENRGAKVVWVINKYNGGINKRAFFGFLKLKRCTTVPMVDMEAVYTAEYNCRLPSRTRPIAAAMQKPLEEIINLHRIHI